MNLTDIEGARSRVKDFLLPNLAALLDVSDKGIFNPNFERKSAKVESLARSSLRLTNEIAPLLNEQVELVCERLKIPRHLVDVYVFPSADLNGFCFVDELPIIVGLSSSIVKTLTGDELAFVLGHEIGHALFKETTNFIANSSCLEDQILARSIEISVDRVGLLASGDVDASFRAILKTLSGLNDSVLRYDFSHFMSEARDVLDTKITDQLLYSSHPPLAQRFKALVSFSTSDSYLKLINTKGSAGIPIEQVNRVISAGLNNSVDTHAYKLINEALSNVLVWVSYVLIASKRTVNLSDLKSLCEVSISKSDIEKAAIFLDSYTLSEKSSLLNEKITQALVSSATLAPRATDRLIARLETAYPEIKFNNIESIARLVV